MFVRLQETWFLFQWLTALLVIWAGKVVVHDAPMTWLTISLTNSFCVSSFFDTTDRERESTFAGLFLFTFFNCRWSLGSRTGFELDAKDLDVIELTFVHIVPYSIIHHYHREYRFHCYSISSQEDCLGKVDPSSRCYKTFFGGKSRKSRFPPKLKQQD